MAASKKPMEIGYVQARSDNLPMVDAAVIINFVSTNEDYISAESRNTKSARAMRESYTSSAVGMVRLRREGHLCTVKGEVVPEHKQTTRNYQVTMVVDETSDTVVDLKCHDCVASRGGCKHALVFLIWMSEKASQPSPTSVESYWCKPKLANVSATAVLSTKDFGEVQGKAAHPEKFLLSARSPAHPVHSMFHRYHTDLDEVECLDMRQMCITYAMQTTVQNPPASDFLDFCKSVMTEEACQSAFARSSDQSDSRFWHLLRYGRITASNFHAAAQSKAPEGGVLKEFILGAETIKPTDPMKRGTRLESPVLKVVEKKEKIKIERVGLKLSPELPEYGASPDGLSSEYVIEIKCPSKAETVRNYVSKNNVVAPKCNAQMQLQMKLCKRSKALFCVVDPKFETFVNKSEAVNIIPVNYDDDLTTELLTKSRAYWEKYIFPVLLEASRK